MQPLNEVSSRRRSSQFPQARRVLSAMVMTVHGRLRQRLAPANFQRWLEPHNLNQLFHPIQILFLHELTHLFKTLPPILLQVRHGREVIQFLEFEL